MKITPIDIGTIAKQILDWKIRCYNEKGTTYLILFSVGFSVLIAFLFAFFLHLVKTHDLRTEKEDTIEFAYGFSILVQFLLGKHTHFLEMELSRNVQSENTQNL